MNTGKLLNNLFIIANSLVLVLGVVFLHWSANHAICFYWMDIWYLVFFNILKVIVLAKKTEYGSIGPFFIIMFGVVGLTITNIIAVVVISPDLTEIKAIWFSLILAFATHCISFYNFSRVKKVNESGDFQIGVGAANKAAVALIVVAACGMLSSLKSHFHTPQVMLIPLLSLIAVRTFFDIRGGFLKIE